MQKLLRAGHGSSYLLYVTIRCTLPQVKAAVVPFKTCFSASLDGEKVVSYGAPGGDHNRYTGVAWERVGRGWEGV